MSHENAFSLVWRKVRMSCYHERDVVAHVTWRWARASGEWGARKRSMVKAGEREMGWSDGAGGRKI